LNVFAMFSHSNIALSEKTDALARRFIVTPDMHRVHHSTHQPETDSNYGVVTPLWDRLFGTYAATTRAPTTTMPLGLEEIRGAETHNLAWLLAVPALSFKTGEKETQDQPAAPAPVSVTAFLPTRAYRPPF
jgi:sterol desaturase/sphingolipid hydroxylase (fatty acid hydroxylase superfamily)